MDQVYKIYKRMHNANSINAKVIHIFLRVVYSCDIMPKTQIGDNSTFAHKGLGVVISEKVIIGNGCHICQNVTIGGRKGNPKCPVIGNNVLIGTGAIILGDITIGDNAKIGAGAIVIDNVPEGATVVSPKGQIIREEE